MQSFPPQQLGLLDRTLDILYYKLLEFKEQQVEILISVLGFHHDKMIDLLNMEQQVDQSLFTQLKIKREDNIGVTVENLIQMGSWSKSEFQSIINISNHSEVLAQAECSADARIIFIKRNITREGIACLFLPL